MCVRFDPNMMQTNRVPRRPLPLPVVVVGHPGMFAMLRVTSCDSSKHSAGLMSPGLAAGSRGAHYHRNILCHAHLKQRMWQNTFAVLAVIEWSNSVGEEFSFFSLFIWSISSVQQQWSPRPWLVGYRQAASGPEHVDPLGVWPDMEQLSEKEKPKVWSLWQDSTLALAGWEEGPDKKNKQAGCQDDCNTASSVLPAIACHDQQQWLKTHPLVSEGEQGWPCSVPITDLVCRS